MINILVFGDSNSWGFIDEDEGQRYNKRWPLILADYLNQSGLSCNLHEDSLPGRTTNVNDERDGIHLNGLSVFKSCLLAHSPIDMILLISSYSADFAEILTKLELISTLFIKLI